MTHVKSPNSMKTVDNHPKQAETGEETSFERQKR